MSRRELPAARRREGRKAPLPLWELGDQAQELLAALGGAPYPLRQKVIASSETSGRFGKVACDESVVGEDDRSGS
jgi:hypothetical protein